MTPTDETRVEMRGMIDETIPPGGTDLTTRILDREIDGFLSRSTCLEEAAWRAWMAKASRAFSERGGLEVASAGSERHQFVSIREYRDHCLSMADYYRSQVPRGGSLALGIQAPDVLGTESNLASELYGGT